MIFWNKNPFLNRKNNKERFSIFGIAVLIIISLFILNLTPLSEELKEFFYFLSTPIQEKIWQQGRAFSSLFDIFFKARELKEENERLKRENQQLVVGNIELENYREQNQALRRALEVDLEKDFEVIYAKPIAKDISRDYIIINKGSAEGVIFDAPVITEERVLVGKIDEVYEHNSKIQIVTAKNSSFDVEILDRQAYGLAEGKGNFYLSLNLVPRDKEINDGDNVFTSILGGNFPQGLLVGKIKNIKKTDTISFQEAQIDPAFNIDELKNLFIVVNF